MRAQLGILWHKHVADRVVTNRWQLHAKCGHFFTVKPIWNLHQQSGAIAHQRISANGAAMSEVFEHKQTVFDYLMRLDALHVGNKANAAGIMLIARIIKTLCLRKPECFGRFDCAVLHSWNQILSYRWRHNRHGSILSILPAQ